MKNISKHITYKEAIFSSTAIKLGITNIPNDENLANMKLLAGKIFEPLREWYKKPVYISSFFRSQELNKAIGGAPGSQHLAINGAAAIDLICNENAKIFHYIRKNLEFDQLIWENGNDENPDWVHVSYSKFKNRKEILKTKYLSGHLTYHIWKLND